MISSSHSKSNTFINRKGVSILLFVILLSACQNTEDRSSKIYPQFKTHKAWKKILTADTYEIMVEGGTEPAFNNAYFNKHDKGVYVGAATGEPLFRSEDKFESGTGWPSFTKPIKDNVVTIRKDNSFGMERDEVVESKTGLHLGHLFDDGPEDKGGKRFCINSAALKFIKDKR
ncbi:MAG: msrB [Daejeonella sp.]|nr:msrB [Daejeonella sp.]